jgi:Bax protein
LGQSKPGAEVLVAAAALAASWAKPEGMDFAAADSATLQKKFAAIGYSLEGVRGGTAGVPRIFLSSLPADLSALASIAKRKRLFIQAILPLVLEANEVILADRRRLIELLRRRERGDKMAPAEAAWLRVMTADYCLEPDDSHALRRRVDAVPPALALAQAAAESGWGTSRFAHKGNAVFGQRTWVRGNGLVPKRRDEDKRHEVKKFGGLRASVAAYMMNLNCHPAYRAFRDLRARMRDRDGRLDSSALAGSLIRYAEIGRDYIETLRIIMRVNRLQQLDGAVLEQPGTVAPDA